METVSLKYKDIIAQMRDLARAETKVSLQDLYKEGNTELLPFIDSIIQDNLLEGSDILAFERLEKLSSLADQGKKCILLVEHYSNFDLPVLSYLLRQKGKSGKKIAESIVAIAGIKLSETNKVVSAFSEAYSRLVIYPSRSIEEIESKISDPVKRANELMKANAINLASMRTMARLKSSGKIILVFPAGTRYRPWDPDSKKGVREIDSYLRTFDYLCFVSINGNILRINSQGEMLDDLVCRDQVLIKASEPLSCSEFRNTAKENIPADSDIKQAVADAVMHNLEQLNKSVS